jgi:hypothetical protein
MSGNTTSHDHRVFTGLNVDVRDACRAGVEQQIGDLIEPGAVTGECAIVPPHATIKAVFAAKVGDFHHGTNEHTPAKMLETRVGSAFMKTFCALPRLQQFNGWYGKVLNHRPMCRAAATSQMNI